MQRVPVSCEFPSSRVARTATFLRGEPFDTKVPALGCPSPIMYSMTGSSQSENSGKERQPGGRNRVLGAVVFVLVFALVTGGVVVLRQALKSAPAEANGTPTSATGAESGR